MVKEHETAVDRVDRKFRARGMTLAQACDVDRSTPVHWNRPTSEKNGRGGGIPDKYHAVILTVGKRVRAGITAADLINEAERKAG